MAFISSLEQGHRALCSPVDKEDYDDCASNTDENGDHDSKEESTFCLEVEYRYENGREWSILSHSYLDSLFLSSVALNKVRLLQESLLNTALKVSDSTLSFPADPPDGTRTSQANHVTYYEQ